MSAEQAADVPGAAGADQVVRSEGGDVPRIWVLHSWEWCQLQTDWCVDFGPVISELAAGFEFPLTDDKVL